MAINYFDTQGMSGMDAGQLAVDEIGTLLGNGFLKFAKNGSGQTVFVPQSSQAADMLQYLYNLNLSPDGQTLSRDLYSVTGGPVTYTINNDGAIPMLRSYFNNDVRSTGVNMPLVNVADVSGSGQDQYNYLSKFMQYANGATARKQYTDEGMLKDVVGSMGKFAPFALAVVAPELLPYYSAVSTIANGGNFEDALKSYAISSVAGEVGSNVSAGTGSNIAGGAAAGATGAGLSGGDIQQGAISGGLSGGISDAAQGISDRNFQDWAQEQSARDYENSVGPTEQDVLAADPSIKMDFPTSTAPGSTGAGYYNEITGEYIPSDIGGLRGPIDENAPVTSMDGYTYDPTSKTWTTPEGESYNMGYLQSLGQAVSGSDLVEPASTPTPEGYDPTFTKSQIRAGLNLLKNTLMEEQSASQAQKQRQRALGYAFNQDQGVPWLDTRAQMLKGIDLPDETTDTGPVGGLAGSETKGAVPGVKTPSVAPHFAGMTPDMLSVLQDRGINVNMAQGGPVQHFACGSSASYCSTWGPMGQYAPKFYAVKCNMLTGAGGKRNPLGLAQLKQLQSHIANAGNIGGMARGGLPAKYEEAKPEGHNPEFITGLTGYYAGGRGTGQSDDIPAMLHDGDYVIDAEAVSAFGDGSSKAGNDVLMHFLHQIPHSKNSDGKPVPAKIADGEVVLPESFVTALGGGDNKRGAHMLDQMRQRLREHKRSAPNSKIPPKAKSPLEYLKGAKG